MLESTFSIMNGFLRSVGYIAKQLEDHPSPGQADTCQEDARHLASIADTSIDVVITSHPYLNAIHYLRGHRLSLVRLGYSLSELRAIRVGSIGAERAPSESSLLLFQVWVNPPFIMQLALLLSGE